MAKLILFRQAMNIALTGLSAITMTIVIRYRLSPS
jgi:hypothetical protein